jgi:hypothetical protein
MWEDRKALWRREGKVVNETISGVPLFRVRKVTVDGNPAPMPVSVTQKPGTVEVVETHVKNE